MCAGEGQREGDTEWEAGSELSAQSPTWGSNSRTARSWPELKSDTQPTEPPRRPGKVVILNVFTIRNACPWVLFLTGQVTIIAEQIRPV